MSFNLKYEPYPPDMSQYMCTLYITIIITNGNVFSIDGWMDPPYERILEVAEYSWVASSKKSPFPLFRNLSEFLTSVRVITVQKETNVFIDLNY